MGSVQCAKGGLRKLQLMGQGTSAMARYRLSSVFRALCLNCVLGISACQQQLQVQGLVNHIR